MKTKWRALLAVFTMVFAFVCIYVEPSAMMERNQDQVFTKRTLVKGSVGNDVRELQGRLKQVGFYKGKITGNYDWGTYWAVRNFQYKFGIKVDGKVGSKTRTKLVRASRGYNPYKQAGATTAARGGGKATTKARGAARPATTQKSQPLRKASFGGRNLTANDLKLMSNAVYGESRGEPYIGQIAVAAVILNRLENSKFPNSVPSIIFQPGAFTAVADGQIWLTPNAQSAKAVQDAIKGWDPTTGAIYYFNPVTATSKWIWSRPQIKKIGKHIFCR